MSRSLSIAQAPSLVARFWSDTRDTFSPLYGYPSIAAFTLRFWRFVLAQIFSSSVFFFLAMLLCHPQYRATLAGVLALKILAGSLLSALIVHKFYPIHLSAQGLRARNPVGIARRLDWDEIVRVDRLWWTWHSPFLRISSRERPNAIWMPLFLHNMSGFIATVKEHAPPDNLLRRFFEENPHW